MLFANLPLNMISLPSQTIAGCCSAPRGANSPSLPPLFQFLSRQISLGISTSSLKIRLYSPGFHSPSSRT